MNESSTPSPGNTGAQAEEQAKGFLEAQGLQLTERNYRCHQGELDLIMQDGETVVFVEVRYRKNAAFGGPAASITPAKQRRIIIAANHYLQSRQDKRTPACRFDVLAITGKDPQNISWIKDAFQSDF
ncbi:YraN family protein [Pseudomonadota bacterium]